MAKNIKMSLGKDDYENSGGRRIAPGGTYVCRVCKESKAKDMTSGRGAEVRLEVIGPAAAKKYRGIFFFDNIGPGATFKVAQLLRAIGKEKKDLVFPDGFLKLIKGEEVRVSVRVKNDEEYGKQNKIEQYLPASEGADAATMDEEEDEDEDEIDEDEFMDEDDEEDEDEDEEDEEEEDEDEDEDEDDEEEEDEDEDEDEDKDEEDEDDELTFADEDLPKPPKQTAKKSAAKKTAKKTTKKRR